MAEEVGTFVVGLVAVRAEEEAAILEFATVRVLELWDRVMLVAWQLLGLQEAAVAPELWGLMEVRVAMGATGYQAI